MKKLLCSLLLVLSLGVFAKDITKADIEKSLKQMQDSGMFSAEQIEAARKQLSGMNDGQINALTKQAQAKASDPEVQAQAKAIAEKIKNDPEAQKKIMEQLQK